VYDWGGEVRSYRIPSKASERGGKEGQTSDVGRQTKEEGAGKEEGELDPFLPPSFQSSLVDLRGRGLPF